MAYHFTAFGRKLRGKGSLDVFTRKGLQWELDLQQGIDYSIYLLGAFEPSLLKFYSAQIKSGFVVFDIGANLGAHTLHFAKLVGDTGSVHAFEATEYAYSKLCKNISLNPDIMPRVIATHAFLADRLDREASQKIQASWPLNADSSVELHQIFRGQFHGVGQGIVTTIDTYVERQGLNRIDWFKIDVDGSELSILKGAKETIERFKPKIMMELAPDCDMEVPLRDDEAPQFRPMIELLVGQYGYKMFKIPSLKPISSDVENLLGWIPPGACQNVLLKH